MKILDKIRSLARNTVAMIQTILGLAMSAIMIVVVLFVIATLLNSMPVVQNSTTSGQYNTSLASIVGNIYQAITLLGVALIIGAVMFIVMIVYKSMGGGLGGLGGRD